MKAFTFIAGHLVDHMRLDSINPQVLLLGRLDMYEKNIAGDYAVVRIDAGKPPFFTDLAKRTFSRTSYVLERQGNQILCSLQRENGLPDDRALVRINTCGPNKKIFGRWEIVRGKPRCLAHGFGADGEVLFICSHPEKRKPPVTVPTGKWNEGLFIFSPGDAMVVMPQRPDGALYRLEYLKSHGLQCSLLPASQIRT